MQHVFEFIATLKPSESGQHYIPIQKLYVTKSSRIHKVADHIYKTLWDTLNISRANIEDFKIRKIK